MLLAVAGIVMLLKLPQFANALLPIFMMQAPPLTLFNFLHPQNAFVPIVITLFPIVIDFSDALFLNAFAEIPVTLQVILFTMMVSGIFMDAFFDIGFVYSTLKPSSKTL